MKVNQPRSLEQATALAERRATIAAEVLTLEARRQTKLGRINAAADAKLAPLVAEAEAIATAVKPWWKNAAPELLKGKRKSMEIGGCKVGTRVTSEKLEFALGDDKIALASLADQPFRSRVTQQKRVLDKPAIAALLKGKSAIAQSLRALGFRIAGGEDAFFLTPIDSGEAKVSAR